MCNLHLRVKLSNVIRKAEDEPAILNSEKPEENWLVKLENVDEAKIRRITRSR